MKHAWIRGLMAASITVAALAVTACGGSDSSNSASSNTALDGVVAVGAPVPMASVTVKDSNGLTKTAQANIDGYYSFSNEDINTLKAPFIIQATGVVGGTTVKLHSLLSAAPVAGSGKLVLNVTPATDAITAQALQADPATVFKDKAPASVDAIKLDAAKERLQVALADVLTALGEDPKKIDLFSTPFSANSQGLDKLFDLIAIQTNATSATQRNVVLTEKKSGGQSVTVSTLDTAATVKTLPAPGIESKLDTASINSFVTNFNRLVKSVNGIQSEEMLALFDQDFLDRGMNRTALIEDLATNAVGTVELGNIVIDGCTVVGTVSTSLAGSICKGRMTVSQSDGAKETMAMSFRLAADNKWRAYGSQSPFDFEIKPIAFQQFNYAKASDLSPSDTTVKTGINFWFTGQVNNIAKYKSAKLYSSNDNGSSWTFIMGLKAPSSGSSCPPDVQFLPIDGGANGECSNFISISDENANNRNQAFAQGKLKVKIEAFATSDYTGESVSHTGYAHKQLFNTASGTQALADLPFSIKVSDLDTGSVNFTDGGAVLESLSLGVKKASTTSSISWNNPKTIKALGSQVTMAAALKKCQGDNPTDVLKSTCDASYGSAAVIKRVHLSARDAQGRGLWKGYSLNGI